MKLKYLALAIVASFTLSACIATQTNQNSTAQSAAVATNTNKVFSQNYVFKELENGLRVLIVKTDYPDLVSHVMKTKSAEQVLRIFLNI